MWKDYSMDYIKNNRSANLSVRLSAFISALFLSLLCGLFYNAWKYEVERITLEEGGWQSRIVGQFSQAEIEAVKNFATVEDVIINERESKGKEIAADLYFYDYGKVLSDTPRIAELAEVSPEKIVYNYELLAMYLIRGPGDAAPRMIFPMFIMITALVAVSLIVVTHNSFAVSMNTRIHQFGIFSSIGATPKQIRTCLLREAAVLCTPSLLWGNVFGIAGSMGVTELSNILLEEDIPGRHRAAAGYHPLIFVLTFVITVAIIWISAWLPAGKMSRLTPLEAIKNAEELQLKHRRKFTLFTHLAGMEGELAVNALQAQRKALRTASLSFLLSFLAYTIMQCFFVLSGISTGETYFERYQEVWDVMITVRDIKIDDFEEGGELRELAGVESAIVYQKAAAKRIITEKEMSEEMKSFGGFLHASESYVTTSEEGWMVNAPVIILDDESFLAYCRRINVVPQLDGAVVLNRIRDVTNPDFRHPDFMPYLKAHDTGKNVVSVLRRVENEETACEIPVLAYTQEVPALREEYATFDYYELVHFIPVSLWEEIKGQIGGAEEDVCICILGQEDVTAERLDAMQSEICQVMDPNLNVMYENRIREYEVNEKQIQGMKAIFGGFCILLAIIGIGNVFSNTLGFVRQRNREFARYVSIGMTPGELRRMFCIEALTLVVRPVLTAFVPAVFIVGYLLKMSYVGVEEFLAEAPFVPVMIFMVTVSGAVVLAYWFAWRNIRKISLAEVLKDDTMM